MGLAVVLVSSVVVVGSAYGYVLLRGAVAKIQRVDGLATAPEVDGQPVVYLIVGSDSRDAPQFEADQEFVTGRRADVIIALVVDPRRSATVLLSIPRDTLAEIPGQGPDKINAAFNSGAQTMVDTVALLLGMPVNHYVEIDFLGFIFLVDAIGRVPLCTDRRLVDFQVGLDLAVGCHQLDGGTALQYVRSRQLLTEIDGELVADPTGDFGRILRQQQFLRSLLASAAKPGNLPHLSRYVAAVSDTVRTDPSFSNGDAVALARRFLRYNPSRVFMVSLPGLVNDLSTGASVEKPTAETGVFLAALRDGRPLPGEPNRTVVLADVAIRVSNGGGIDGCGARIADLLRSKGALVSDDAVGTFARSDVVSTEVTHNPGEAGGATIVRDALGFGTLVETNRPGSHVEVIVGADAAKECEG